MAAAAATTFNLQQKQHADRACKSSYTTFQNAISAHPPGILLWLCLWDPILYFVFFVYGSRTQNSCVSQ